MNVPRSHRNHPLRHLAAVGPDSIFSEPFSEPAFDEPDFGSWALETAAAAREPRLDLFSSLLPYVDDLPALLDLDTEPLPDEAFDWSVVEPRDAEIVAAVLQRCDAACDELLDAEFRTIARRILAIVATRDPRPLRRTVNRDRLAAGIVWLAGRGNGEFGRRSPRWRSARRVSDWFGVSNCSDRGLAIRSSAGLVPVSVDPYLSLLDATPLASTALLHSKTRRVLITQRDACARVERERRSWTLSPDGRSVACRAASVGPLAVALGHDAYTDQAIVLVALGSPGVAFDEADLYGLSLGEARRLADMLHRSLDSTDAIGDEPNGSRSP
jgi:hypothetical protein